MKDKIKSLKKQLMLTMFFIAFISILVTSGLIYYIDKQELEDMLGKNLLGIVHSSVLAIDGDKHQDIFDKEHFDTQEFKEIQTLLFKIKKMNNLTSDVYTLRKDPEKHNLWQFVTMSAKKPYIGNYYTPSNQIINEKLLKCYKSGISQYTHVYTNKKVGSWISAFAPIITSDGEIDAILEVDYCVDFFYNKLKKKAFTVLIISMLCLLIAFFISLVFGNKIFC